MMLKLSSPIVPTPSVHPIQLPFQCAQPGQECQVAGWGTTAARRGKNWAGGLYSREEGWTFGSEGGGQEWDHDSEGRGLGRTPGVCLNACV